MKRRWILAVTIILAASLVLTACGGGTTQSSETKEVIKIGMVTDSGTIDDKSFNQGTWEGILKYVADHPDIAQDKYLQPSGEQATDYLNAISDLVDTGHSIIVTPGYKFETAVNEAADRYKDTATFILIDGMTHNGDYNFVKHDNTVCIYFNEHEAGFLAGVAAALSSKTGKVGFVGGMEIPPVQRYGWGFKAGVKYAEKNFGTKTQVVDYIYQGTFNDVAAGQTLASGMYNKGIDIIFAAAGGVGVGVFNEAKQRMENGQEVYVVGVDVDQYDFGKISSGKSVTLTSAMKRIDVAAYDYIDKKINGTFPGGEIITLTLKDNGVGLPEENPNLTEDIITKVNEVKQGILDGKIAVPNTQETLDAFMQQ